MFLRYIFALPASGKGLLPNGTSGMRFQGHRLTRQFLFGCCGPLSNTHGRAAYWLYGALVLLVICSGVAVLFLTGGTKNKRIQPVISLDQKEDSKPGQRYKIPMPAREAVQLAPGSSSEPVAQEAPAGEYSKPLTDEIGSQAATPLKRTDNVRLAGPAGPADQQDESTPPEIEKRPVNEVEKGGSIAAREDVDPKPPETEKRPVKGVEKGDSIATREDVDPKPPADEKAREQEIALGPDVKAKTGKGSSRKVDKASLQTDAETVKRLFVKVQVGNVRDEPSITSRVKFRLEMGAPVTVTGKRGGWVAVKLDDDRFGWVYHTLLAGSIVPQKATAKASGKIKAIRQEVAAKDVAKVIFELNGPFSPQTMIFEGEKPRVVCDFLDVGLASDIGASIEVNSGIIERIRTGIHKRPKFKVRVVLDLVPERNYEVDQFFFEKENYYVLVVKARE